MRESTGARYLLRFDDICPTMDWSIWDKVEEHLDASGARPILAVIPDNQDSSLHIDPPAEDFWERVRDWQSRGWTIAVHGYQHRYVTSEAGLWGWNARSEFAGLSLAEQEKKLDQATTLFRVEGVEPEAWVAPNHAFDRNTLVALERLGIRTVSDGIALYPYRDAMGMTWIPVQIWRFIERPIGVWTVCLHPNKWGDAELATFSRDLERFRDRLTTVPEMLRTFGSRRKSWLDGAFAGQRRVRKRLARETRRSR